MATFRQRLDQLAFVCSCAVAACAERVAWTQDLALPPYVPQLIETELIETEPLPVPTADASPSTLTLSAQTLPAQTPPAQTLPAQTLPSGETAAANDAAAAVDQPIDGYRGVDEGRPRILFQPAVPGTDRQGQSILRPTVRVADGSGVEILPTPASDGSLPILEPQRYHEGRLRAEAVVPSGPRWQSGGRGERWLMFRERYLESVSDFTGGLGTLMRPRGGYDSGLGVERLPFALSEIDAAQPNNNVRLRFESGYDWEFPDRAEFFWSKLGGKGPPATIPVESSVDYQDIRLAMEVGTDKFSATTEIPLRFVDPTVLPNTGGMGDLVLTTKTVMLDGERLQVTQVLRNQLATGSAKKGRGIGHASMEPGFVAAYRRAEDSMWHSELKLWFPIGGDPDHSGPVLRYGTGYARLWYDSDTLAIIPTFEFVGWSVLTGGQTVPGPLLGSGEVVSIDGLNIFNLYPGLRIAKDTGGDMGIFELGIHGGLSVSNSHWYESLMRLELRWTF